MLFARFDPGRTGCITCPPGRRDHFLQRVLWRALLPFLCLDKLPSSRAVILFLIIPCALYGIIVESFVETISEIGDNMSTFLSSILILVLIGVPTYLLTKKPESFNVEMQIMFSVFLTAVSTWLGVSINNKRARRDATAKWLPAAETACKQLLTLSSTAERMKRTQAQACGVIEPLMAPDQPPNSAAIRALVGNQCRETAEKLATLRDHIENSISHWQVFIGANCEGDECQIIDDRLQSCRDRLFSQIADVAPCTGQEGCAQNPPQHVPPG